MKNAVLTGFMGTGKTEVGRIVARKLNYALVDVDDEIEKGLSMKIADIFRLRGELAFRDMESAAIGSLSERERVVISTGGGAVLRQENMDKLRNKGMIFCLKASAKTIYSRTKGNDDRPLLRVEDPLAKINELLAARQVYYDKADLIIDTEGKSPAEVAEEIITALRSAKPQA